MLSLWRRGLEQKKRSMWGSPGGHSLPTLVATLSVTLKCDSWATLRGKDPLPTSAIHTVQLALMIVQYRDFDKWHRAYT